jgi:ABC-type multidrug transport system ATPase subunit
MAMLSYMDEATRCDRVALIQKAKILSLDTPARINESFGRPLYSVRSKGSGFLLLKELRNVEYCHSAWLFGQEIHISLENEADVQDFEVILLKMDVAEYHRIKPGIEDSFIELMNEENGD